MKSGLLLRMDKGVYLVVVMEVNSGCTTASDRYWPCEWPKNEGKIAASGSASCDTRIATPICPRRKRKKE